MNDFFIFKTSYHMHNGVNFSYMAKEFVAQALALACPSYQPSNIHKLYLCWGCFFCIIQSCQHVQSFVWHVNYANIWLYGAEGIICTLCPCLCYGIKQCAFANIRQSNNSKFHFLLLSFAMIIILYNILLCL